MLMIGLYSFYLFDTLKDLIISLAYLWQFVESSSFDLQLWEWNRNGKNWFSNQLISNEEHQGQSVESFWMPCLKYKTVAPSS